MQKRVGTQRLAAIEDSSGRERNDPSDICEVFAQFYESLYRETDTDSSDTDIAHCSTRVDAVTAVEVRAALSFLKNGRTGAEDGLVAEMLKTGHDRLVFVLAEFFTSILREGQECPEGWKNSA